MKKTLSPQDYQAAWRHQALQSLPLHGQEAACAQLVEMIRARPKPHAMLLSGMEGLGKGTAALAIARFLLAAEKKPPTPDSIFHTLADAPATDAPATDGAPATSTARLIETGAHPDIFLLDSRNGHDDTVPIKIDDIRRLKHFFSLTASVFKGHRVAIIDTVDDMTLSASNALLKTLEEPPPHGILLLVSHRPGALPAPMVSRCHKVAFSPLNTQTIAKLLLARGVEKEQGSAIASLACGSMGMAVKIDKHHGLDLYEPMVQLFSTLPAMDSVQMSQLVETVAKTPHSWQLFMALLLSFLARLSRVAAVHRDDGGACIQHLPAKERLLSQKLAAMTTPLHLVDLWEKGQRFVYETGVLNMDKKHFLTNYFQSVKQAFQVPLHTR